MNLNRFQRLDIPTDLLDKLRKDPIRAPEHIALEAAKWHGPAAAKWYAAQQQSGRKNPAELLWLAKRNHGRMARFTGAATGFGGFLTVVPDLLALAWIQSRLVFFVATIHEFDPLHEMRPAELLTIQELYPDPAAARAALDGIGPTIAETLAGKHLDGNGDLRKKLMNFLGHKAAKRLGGKVIPGFAVFYSAIDNERETRKLADKTARFYSGH